MPVCNEASCLWMSWPDVDLKVCKLINTQEMSTKPEESEQTQKDEPGSHGTQTQTGSHA